MAGNIGGRERAVGKRLGMEEAGKGQLESGWEYRRQGKGLEWRRQGKVSWKGGKNGGGRDRTVRKELGME